jgi:nucleotide-binding universal stress UspA family protein
VPLDGTRVAEHALPPALALARRAGAEVTLVNVYSTLQAVSDPELLGWRGGQYLVEPLRDYLRDLAERVAAAHPVRVRPLLLKGYRTADTLSEMAAWDDLVAVDLIVMAARRRRGWWSRFWRGSVSTEVACRSRAPVLLVPGRDEPPVLTDEPPLSRVLVPLDGSARAEWALGPAAALVVLTKGEFDLLQVVRSHPFAADWSLALGGPPTGIPVGQEWEARRYLRGVAGRLRAGSVPARWQVVVNERPTAEAIARYAELSQADVIAMTNRGGVSLAGLFRGSMAERVARRADVPVLVCRAEVTGLAV